MSDLSVEQAIGHAPDSASKSVLSSGLTGVIGAMDGALGNGRLYEFSHRSLRQELLEWGKIAASNLTEGVFNLEPLNPVQALFLSSTPHLDGTIPDDRPGQGTDRPPLAGAAYKLDGVGTSIAVDVTTTGGIFSVEWGMRSDDALSINKYVFDQGTSSRLIIGGLSSSRDLAFYDGAWKEFGTNINDDTWHHVVMVFDATVARCYVDGVQYGSELAFAGTDLSAALDQRIGGRFSGSGTNYFDTYLRGFRIYDAALTEEQITARAANEEIEVAPLRSWLMEDSHDTIAWDNSGNAAHGAKSGWTTGTGPGTSHYRGADVPYSDANTRGYSDGTGSPIPVLVSDNTTDVLGNPADYVGPSPKPGKAINNNCLTLDGTDDYAEIITNESGGHPYTDLSDAITIAAWIKPDVVNIENLSSWQVGQTICELRELGTTGIHVPFCFGLQNDTLALGVTENHTAGAEKVATAGILSAGELAHVAVVIDGVTVKFYKDGSLVHTATLTTATGDRSVGNNPANYQWGILSLSNGVRIDSPFGGLLFGCQLYSKACTTNEVTYIYSAGTAGDNPGTPLDGFSAAEGAGETLHNTGASGLPATLTGATLPDIWTDNTQDVLAANIALGFSLYEHASLPPLYIPYADGSPHPSPVIPSGYTLTRHCTAGERNNGFEGAIDKTGGIAWPGSAAVDASLKVGDTATPPEYLRELVDDATVAGFDRVLTLAEIPTGDELTALNEWLADAPF